MHARTSAATFLAFLASAATAAAQTGTPAPFVPDPSEPAMAVKEGKVLHAFRLGNRAVPRIDGRLDDEVWAIADQAEGFVQWEPDNMAPLSERTVMQVVYDDRHLYLAMRLYDRTPGAIAAGLGRRDEFPPSDQINVGFDTRHDHLTAYVFQANPSAVQGDFFFYDDDRVDRDYDAVWEVRTSIDNEGWIAEYRIPFSQMRFDEAPEARTVWGLGVRRNIRRRGETGEWTGRPRGERGEVSRWGHLIFDEPLRPPRRIELLPYTLGRSERTSVGPDDAFSGSVGLDARLGIGSASTLSATINPDFGQVEQDPAVLNLTIFETFFPEKRPFFLEDSRTFVPPSNQLFQLFYSRRIGERPQQFPLPASAVVESIPDATTIIGASKFTGKASGWTYGALTALTASESATLTLGTEQLGIVQLIEPRTSYNVVRVQRDIRGSSNIGALATAAIRDQVDPAVTGGLDYNLRWDRNRTTLDGNWALTQAPGLGGVENGFGGVTSFGITRKHISVSTSFDHLSPTFRVNDLGFLRNRVNRTQLGGRVTIEQPDPWRAFRRIGTTLSTSQAWNKDQLVFTQQVSQSVSIQFSNFWAFETGLTRDFETLDDLDTRGGPPIVNPATTFFFVQANSDTRRSWRLIFGTYGFSDAVGSNTVGVTAGLFVQPSGRLQASAIVRYETGQDIAQWIANRDVTGDGVADHVYGTLDRDVVDVALRSTYAINRDLTFQLYLQPFVAVGDYGDIRRLARPSSFEFAPAALATNPDFNRKSLRGTVILRWEYLRGSTLFLVWNMSTLDTSRAGEFSLLRDVQSTFGADGTHVFMVKASYWFSR